MEGREKRVESRASVRANSTNEKKFDEWLDYSKTRQRRNYQVYFKFMKLESSI